MYGEFKRVTSDAQSDFRQAFAEPIRDFQEAANEYKSVFTSAADEVGDSLKETVSTDGPIFIPYEVSDEGNTPLTEDDTADKSADLEITSTQVGVSSPDDANVIEEDH